jgi:hypothetical protein
MYDNLYSIYLYENQKNDGNSLQNVQLQGNYLFKILVMSIPSLTKANKLYYYGTKNTTTDMLNDLANKLNI